MRRKRYANYLSCPKCEKLSARILESLTDKEMLMEDPKEYQILGWLGCAQQKCRNFFQKNNSSSKCPVCKLWSVKLAEENDIKRWKCANKECQWDISAVNVD